MRSSLTKGIEYRARAWGDDRAEAGNGRTISGYPIVFNSWSQDLGGFVECIAPEAVNRALRPGSDVCALFNHDAGVILGRTTSGTLRLFADKVGLAAMIDPPNPTQPENLLESIRRKDLAGMSFGFRTVKDEWNLAADPPRRTVLDMELREISIVVWPAYGATSVAVRRRPEQRRRWPSLKMRERQLIVAGIRLYR